MLHYYCIASCDKCRKARKLLGEKKIEHKEIDMRKDGLADELITNWIDRYGLETILNRKSATWRSLDEMMKADIETSPARVIGSNPAMLNRPILDFGDHILTKKEALDWLEQS